MNLKEFEALKYFTAFFAVAIGFYVYSNMIGWKWLGATATEKEKPATGQHYTRRFFHK